MASVKQSPEPHKSQMKKDHTPDKVTFDIPRDTEKGFPLLHISEQFHGFDDLIVTDDVKEVLEDIVVENRYADRLMRHGMRPKNRILFCGPPGTGKTLSARVISSVVGYKFAHVMFDSVISSYLGETATNLRKIFEFIEKGKFVILFDEFDIVGKKRDDPYEHGEIKRIVNNFIQMMDTVQSHSIIIAATNHQHLLDKAVWRRFDDIVYFDLPNYQRRILLFKKYLRVLKRNSNIPLQQLSRRTKNYSAADIAQVCKEALRKCIIDGLEEVTKDHVMRAMAKQKRRKNTIPDE